MDRERTLAEGVHHEGRTGRQLVRSVAGDVPADDGIGGPGPDTCVLDVGGGDSRLVDVLAARGLDCLAVLDVSGAALHRAQERLGDLAGAFTWIESDVTAAWSLKPMDIWHDRAVFHFLTTVAERAQYRAHLLQTVKPGGAVIIATFALDGPERCSGLPVARYSAETLAQELGSEFRLIEAVRHEHQTPWGAMQPFVYARFRRERSPAPILDGKDAAAPAVFAPLTVLREARRQRQLPGLHVPPVCVLDPDGDIVRWLKRTGTGTLSDTWACYHSEMYEFELAGVRVGVVGCAVGAHTPYSSPSRCSRVVVRSCSASRRRGRSARGRRRRTSCW